MYEKLSAAARKNHKYTPVEGEINELCDAIDDLESQLMASAKSCKYYTDLYISALKRAGDDICLKCVNYHKCEKEKCKSFVSGRGGEIDGKYYDFKWTCEDFNYGECAVLENTPCHGCFDNDFSGFELKEMRKK